MVAVAGGTLLWPSMASAEITEGSCAGKLDFVNGTKDDGPFSVDASQPASQVVAVPRSDTVKWSGSTPAQSGDYKGSIRAELPFPFGSVEIDSWEGQIRTNSNSGIRDFDLPSFVPGGTEFVLSAEHTDSSGTCAGKVTMALEGGPFGSFITWLALVVTIALIILFGGMVGLFSIFGGAGAAAAAGGKS